MRLGDAGGIAGQGDRLVVMQDRVGSGHPELLGGEHVVGLVAVQRRVRRGHPELLGGEHVVGLLSWRWRLDDGMRLIFTDVRTRAGRAPRPAGGACVPCVLSRVIISVPRTEIHRLPVRDGDILNIFAVSNYRK